MARTASHRRISVRIPPSLEQSLRRRIGLTGESESAIVREAVEAHLKASPSRESAYDLAARLGWVGAAKGLPKDLSTNKAHMSGFGKAGFGKNR